MTFSNANKNTLISWRPIFFNNDPSPRESLVQSPSILYLSAIEENKNFHWLNFSGFPNNLSNFWSYNGQTETLGNKKRKLVWKIQAKDGEKRWHFQDLEKIFTNIHEFHLILLRPWLFIWTEKSANETKFPFCQLSCPGGAHMD